LHFFDQLIPNDEDFKGIGGGHKRINALFPGAACKLQRSEFIYDDKVGRFCFVNGESILAESAAAAGKGKTPRFAGPRVAFCKKRAAACAQIPNFETGQRAVNIYGWGKQAGDTEAFAAGVFSQFCR